MAANKSADKLGELHASGGFPDARCSSVSSCLFSRARRAGERRYRVLIRAPIITPVARSFSGTVGFVISGWLAVLSDFVTPMASTIT